MELRKEGHRLRKAPAGVLPVVLLAGHLDVQQHRVGLGQQAAHRLIQAAAAGVQAGGHTVGVAEGKQFGDELRLQQSLPAGDGDAPVLSVVPLVAVDLFGQVGGLGGRAAAYGPGIRVMAVGTPQRAPLQKHHKADAGAVHRAKALQRMDIADHRAGLLTYGRGRSGR